MTKLESGAIAPNLSPHDVGEIVGSALHRAARILGAARGRGGDRRRLADAGPRCRPVRAGAVQSSRQCGQIRAGRNDHSHCELAASRTPSISRFSTREMAFPRRSWSTSSTSSIGRKRAIRFRPGPASGSRSPAGSSRRCTARSARPTAPTGPAPCSRSRCRFRQSLGSWIRRHDSPFAPRAGHRRRAAHPQAPADGAGHAGP